MEENVVFNSEDVNQNKAFGVLAYIGILFLIPLFAAKDSQYARFHTNQGIVLLIMDIVFAVIAAIVSLSMAFVPIMGSIVSALVTFLLEVVSLVFMILGIVNACSGEAKKLPIIGGITILK